MKKTFVVLLLLLFGCGMITNGEDFSTLASGSNAAGITEQINKVFTDSQSFNSFWEMISSNKMPAPKVPAVDFSKDMVIAVSPGQMNTGGYTVEITEVKSDGKKIMVTVVVTKPNGFATTVLTQPYHIIVLKKAELPVEFFWEENSNSLEEVGCPETPTTSENPNVYVPMFKGNLARTGAYEAKGVPELTGILWEFHMNARGELGYWYYVGGEPVISGGVIYATGIDYNLYALDAKTGAKKWQFNIGETIFNRPYVYGGVVYVGSDEGFLYAVDANTGNEKWQFPVQGEVIVSTVYRGVIYAGSDLGVLYAVDACTGKELWHLVIDTSVASTGLLSPVDSSAVFDGVIYVVSGYSKLFALDSETKVELWRFTDEKETPSLSIPAVSDDLVYVGGSNGFLYALNAKTGNERWRFKVGNNSCSSPAVSDGIVYVGGEFGSFYAVDATTGKERWRFEYGGVGGVYGSPQWWWNSATISSEVVYVGNSDGFLYALDAITGKELWQFEVSDGVGSSVVVSDGVVYVQSMDDHIYAIH